MKITETWTYAATPDRVWAMITDPAFQERKCAASGALSFDVSVEQAAGDGATVVTSRRMPTDGLPSQFQKFVKDGLEVVETQTWEPAAGDGSRSGRADVQIKGTPVTMKGTLTMAPAGEGTTLRLDADVKAGIPLVGGQIEKAVAPAVVHGIKVEEREGAAYLTGA